MVCLAFREISWDFFFPFYREFRESRNEDHVCYLVWSSAKLPLCLSRDTDVRVNSNSVPSSESCFYAGKVVTGPDSWHSPRLLSTSLDRSFADARISGGIRRNGGRESSRLDDSLTYSRTVIEHGARVRLPFAAKLSEIPISIGNRRSDFSENQGLDRVRQSRRRVETFAISDKHTSYFKYRLCLIYSTRNLFDGRAMKRRRCNDKHVRR